MFKSIFFGLLGVGSKEQLKQDELEASWLRIILSGVTMAAIFIAAIVFIVNMLLVGA